VFDPLTSTFSMTLKPVSSAYDFRTHASIFADPWGSWERNWLQGKVMICKPREWNWSWSSLSSEYHLAVFPQYDATLHTIETLPRNAAKGQLSPRASRHSNSKKLRGSTETSHVSASAAEPPMTASLMRSLRMFQTLLRRFGVRGCGEASNCAERGESSIVISDGHHPATTKPEPDILSGCGLIGSDEITVTPHAHPSRGVR